MKKWQNKYVIGLTGNIATGKSVVRKMLEYLGAYGIDADTLGHRAFMAGSPGYKQTIEEFGVQILNDQGQIDRNNLSKIVFADPKSLIRLESIVHPLVYQGIDFLVRHTSSKVIIIEAIKLLEGDLYTLCDSIWVVNASVETQQYRLMQKRKMNEVNARNRIQAQSAQERKLAIADVIIQNDNSFEDTWEQVVYAWLQLFPEDIDKIQSKKNSKSGSTLTIQRAYPYHAQDIAYFFAQYGYNKRKMSKLEVMAEFSKKTYLILQIDDKIVGLMDWQVDDFVARAGGLCMVPHLSQVEGMRLFLEEIERSIQEYPCEVVLLFIPPRLAQKKYGWQDFGYEIKAIEELLSQTWQDAAREFVPAESVMLFKRL